MSRAIDYYFWASSDWAYLGHRRLLELASRADATVRYRPVRMGPLLDATGGIVLAHRSSQRQAYRETELRRWTKQLGFPLNISPRHFPIDNEKALRLLVSADNAGRDIGGLAEAIMRAVWQEDRDIARAETLVEIATACGFDAAFVRTSFDDEAAANALSNNTNSAIAAGVLGAPSYVVDEEVFWGQDRLPQLAAKLGLGQATWRGELKGIYAAEMAGVEMETLPEVRLIAGIGVEGDRYATAQGYYSGKPHPDRQVTLIEEETLEALKRDHDITLLPEETRRNLVTSGVPLNHLVGRRFRVGSVELFGGRLNVPCMYLERLLDKKVFDPLINRSGLNCQILNTGEIRVGDAIVPVE